MLKKIMNEVDTNGDGKIQYEGALFNCSGVGVCVCLFSASHASELYIRSYGY